MNANDRIVGIEDANGLLSAYLLPALDSRGRPFRREAVLKAAESSDPVLILGETGTGKEQMARLLHAWGPRRNEPFVPVDCGALGGANRGATDLFGWAEGSFTAADREHPGLIHSAGGGTLFLDEIANMEAGDQRKLLRFLQSGEYSPLGDTSSKRSSARIVAATNKKVADSIAQKDDALQQDVAARFPIRFSLPPLRDRGDDVFRLMLMPGFLDRDYFGWTTPKALLTLLLDRWPDNIRSLQRCLRSSRDDAGPGTPEAAGVLASVPGTARPENFDTGAWICTERAAALCSADRQCEESQQKSLRTRDLVSCIFEGLFPRCAAVSITRLQSCLMEPKCDYALLNLPVDSPKCAVSILLTGEGTFCRPTNTRPFGSLVDVVCECAEVISHGLQGDGMNPHARWLQQQGGDCMESIFHRPELIGPDVEERRSWEDFGCPRPMPAPNSVQNRKWSPEIVSYVRRLRADGMTPMSIAETLGSAVTPDQAKEIYRTYGNNYPDDRPLSKGGRPRKKSESMLAERPTDGLDHTAQ